MRFGEVGAGGVGPGFLRALPQALDGVGPISSQGCERLHQRERKKWTPGG